MIIKIMFRRIPYSFINKLLAKTDIVDLINTKITLKKQGKNYHTNCPFHNEKIPSFTVSRDKQFYYCFGCGVHGNSIDFLMNYNHLNFIEAIKELACIHGLKVPFIGNNTFQIEEYKRQKLYQLMNDISKFYQYSLNKPNSYRARLYLRQRGLNNEIIYRFSIGFAPIGWKNLIGYFSKYNNNYKQLNDTGMLAINSNGHAYDRFRKRIMFPIKDYIGNVVGFGGRVIDDTLPKYLNSPETKIFHKGNQLYGLYEAKQNNQIISKLLIVEGYMDVITLAQFGINYAVASLGTSITTEHIKLLFRTANTIICCYDGDEAGNKAAWRILETALPYLNTNYQLQFMILPNGEDPDSLIRKEGRVNFEHRINRSYSFSKFLFNNLVTLVDLTNYEGKSKLSNLAIPLINKIKNENVKLYLAKKLGNFIGIPDVLYILNMIEKGSFKKINYNKPKIKLTIIQILIALLIQNPDFVNLVPILNHIKYFKIPGLVLFLDLVKLYKSNQNMTIGQLLEYYRNNKFVIKQLEKLITWNDIKIKEIAKKMFIDTLKHLFITVLDERFKYLITKERTKGLTNEERKEVHLITKTK